MPELRAHQTHKQNDKLLLPNTRTSNNQIHTTIFSEREALCACLYILILTGAHLLLLEGSLSNFLELGSTPVMRLKGVSSTVA